MEPAGITAQRGSFGGATLGGSAQNEARKTTTMENVYDAIASSLSRLRETNGIALDMLDRFEGTQRPSNDKPPTVQSAPPQPGTKEAIGDLLSALSNEISRSEELTNRLRAIF